jgi:hypothetical protein
MNMSFVVAVPGQVQTAGQDLAGMRSALDEVTEAIAVPVTSLAPAAGDQVSAAVAALFRNFGEEYQALDAHAAAFHNTFVNAMIGGAAAYTEAEIANNAALLSGGGSLATAFGGALSGFGAAVGESLSVGLTSSLGARLGGDLEVLLIAGLGRLDFQTGGFILSSIRNGLVQAGNAVVPAGLALENSGAALSSLGTQPVVQAGAALSALLNVNVAVDISTVLSAGLRGLSLALPGLPGLTLPGLTLPNLGADVGAVTNGELALPGATFPGLPGLTLPGLPGLTMPNLGTDIGAVINTKLALPKFALDVFAGLPRLTLPGLPGLPGLMLPGLPGLTLPG